MNIIPDTTTPSTKPLDAEVSCIDGKVTRTKPTRTESLRVVLNEIRDGKHASRVSLVRKHRAAGDKEAQKDSKECIGYFVPTGKYRMRNNAGLIEGSGVLVGDSDDMTEPEATKAKMHGDPHICFAFLSPSGDGLKIGVCVPKPKNAADHDRSFEAVKVYLADKYRIRIKDMEQAKALSQPCYYSHDPNLLTNENAVAIDVLTPELADELGIVSDYPPEYQGDKQQIDVGSNVSDIDKARAAIARLNAARADNYGTWFKVGMASKSVSNDLLPDFERFSQLSTKYKPGEPAEKWESFKRNGVGLGSLIHWANEDDPAGKPKRKPKQRAEGDTRPEVRVRDDDLAVLVDEAWGALRCYNNTAPRIFRFGNIVADISSDARNELTIRPLARDAMRETLARAAYWFKLRKESDATTGEATFTKAPTKAPGELAALMCATPSATLPVLQRIVRAPMLTASGRIHYAPGYDPDSRCWFAIDGLALPAVSSNPTPDEIKAAREMFTIQTLGDFPFVSDGDRANCLALFLLPFVREMIDGPTPLHLIEKPLPGSGASLLAEAQALITRGTGAGFMTEGSDDDEWRKRITATLLKGPEIVVIDNISRELASGALSSALTAAMWEDRMLGQTQMLTLPIRCVWLATGNNPTTSSEIARRVVPIRIDPKTDKPTERASFRHPKLLTWVRENRAALVHASLTLASAWLAAGKPEGKANLASFERWASVMGGLLDVAGVPGFLSNRLTFQSRADVVGELTRAFIAEWAKFHREERVSAGDLAIHAQDFDFGNCSNNGWRIRFGKFLRGLVGRVFTFDGVGLTIEGAGTMNGASAYRLQGSEGSQGGFPP